MPETPDTSAVAVLAFNDALATAVERAVRDCQKISLSNLCVTLDIGRVTLWRLCQDTNDPFPRPAKIRGQWFFPVEEVRQWLQRRPHHRGADDPLEALAQEFRREQHAAADPLA
jgi:predicted DNA-binding transcriptional regulator AlpA